MKPEESDVEVEVEVNIGGGTENQVAQACDDSLGVTDSAMEKSSFIDYFLFVQDRS